MKKITLEVAFSITLVMVLTFFAYRRLSGVESFWDAQLIWSIALILCWVIVSVGYYHQGWLVRTQHKSKNVSIILPTAVFFVQCILFVKGVYYRDWSLVGGALIVNSGVVFCLSQIISARRRFPRG